MEINNIDSEIAKYKSVPERMALAKEIAKLIRPMLAGYSASMIGYLMKDVVDNILNDTIL